MNYQERVEQIQSLDQYTITDITCGNSHSIAICQNQSGIWVWGKSDLCNLGMHIQKNKQKQKQESIQQNNSQLHYIKVKAHSASSGNQHTYVWKQNEVYCWGSNKQYKLGLQEQRQYELTKSQIFAQAIETGMQLNQITCGDSHSLAVFKLKEKDQISFQVFAWGQSKSNQLALQTDGAVFEPIMIDFQQPVKHIYSRSDFNFILTLNGDCYSWGTNVFGRLGFPKTISSQKIPTKIKTLSKIKSISMGIHHCIAITQKQQAYSWGKGLQGQLGLNQIISEATPTKIQISQRIVQASCGENHSIILTTNNQLMSCGVNSYYALGHNDVDSKKRCLKFVKIRLQTDKEIVIKKIASGDKHNLMLTQDGKVYSWGYNKDGQLGRSQIFTKQKINIKKQLYKQMKNETNSHHVNNNTFSFKSSQQNTKNIKIQVPLIKQQIHQNNYSQQKQSKKAYDNKNNIQQKIQDWKTRYEKFKKQKQQQQQKFMLQLQQILTQNKLY